MRWEDESYVKVYTRDTLTWLSWSWQARTVFLHLMRKVDHAGILECGGFDPSKAIAIAVGVPEDVVAPGLTELAKTGTVEVGPGKVILLKFVEAQEARKTERLRKKDQHQRDRDKARADGFVGSDAGCDAVSEAQRRVANAQPPETAQLSHSVTRGHAESHDVTPVVTRSHTESRGVTRGHSPSPSSSPTSSSSPISLVQLESALDTEDPRPAQMLATWNKSASGNIPKARDDEGRQKKLARWLKDRSFAEWEAIVARVNASAFLRGERGDFKATLDWVLQPKNLAKVLDGNYDDRDARPSAQAGPPCSVPGCQHPSTADLGDHRVCREHDHRANIWWAAAAPNPEGRTWMAADWEPFLAWLEGRLAS